MEIKEKPVTAKADLKQILDQIAVNVIFAALPLSYTRLGVAIRKKIHPILVKIFAETLPHKIKIIRNDYIKEDNPTIYSATHVSFDDIASIICSAPGHMYLIADSDTKKDITPLEALALYINGVMFFEKDKDLARKNEKKILNKRIVRLLRYTDILYFPESTWNFRHNKLVRNALPWGMLTNADKRNADMVPVAFDQIGEEYCVSFGDKIKRTDDKAFDIVTLRDDMATLVWELFELKDRLKREDVGPDEIDWYNYIQEKCGGDSTNYDFVKEDKCAFRGKNNKKVDETEGDITSLDEVIADMFGIPSRSISSDYEIYKKIRRLSDYFAGISSEKDIADLISSDYEIYKKLTRLKFNLTGSSIEEDIVDMTTSDYGVHKKIKILSNSFLRKKNY